MSDKEIRYNRSFLDWDQSDIKNDNKEYIPNIHIHPTKGLLNDPNCVFFLGSKYYIFFQHHPNNTFHGLKTMSLAITSDFKNYEYKYMLNKPTDNFSYHGIYSGNAIIYNKKIICMYTGNARDNKWIRTSSIVIAEYDLKNESFINKKVIMTNFDYKSYTEHFRDPFIFKYKNSLYFALGAQKHNNQGVILIFQLDNNLMQAKLLHEIHFNNKYRMIECPNVIIKNKTICFIYSPQFKQEIISNDTNPDIVRCVVTNVNRIFCINKFNIDLSDLKEQYIDYGFEFYAPQVFLKKSKYNVIAWSGIPTSNNYPESKNGWIFCLSSIRKIKIKNDNIIFSLSHKNKNAFNINELTNKKSVHMKINDQLIIGDDRSQLVINFSNNKYLTIERKGASKYYPYKNQSIINFHKDINKLKIDIFYDVSIIEICINKKYWFTSRLYPTQFEIKRKYYE